MDEHNHVGVLLDGAGIAQVGQRGTLVFTVGVGAGQLGAGDQRHLQLQRDGLELAADFGNLQLAAFHLAVGMHQAQVVHHDQVKALVHHQAAAAGAQLGGRDTRSIVDKDAAVGHRADGARQAHPVIARQRALADALHVDLRVRAEQTQSDLFAGHFQREHRHGLAAVQRRITGHVHRQRGLAHGGARAQDDQLAAVEAGQQLIQRREARRHAGDAPLELGQLLNAGVGIVQHVLDGLQSLAGRAVHHDIENGLFRMAEGLLQGILLGITLLRDLLGGLDELSQRGLFRHDADIRFDVGRRGHILHQAQQVLGTARAFKGAAPGQFAVQRDEVNGLLLPVEGDHRVEDLLVLGLVEILRQEGFCGLEDGVAVLQHCAKDALLRFDAIGRRHALVLGHLRSPPSFQRLSPRARSPGGRSWQPLAAD